MHQRGFASAVGPKDAHDLSMITLQAEIVDGQHVFVEQHQVPDL
jgi:hypothetical protein